MELLKTAIAIIVGVIGIVAALYNFWKWLKQSRKPSVPPLPDKTALALLRLQRRELEVWRLFDFHRDIHMDDVHVQEILTVVSPIGHSKVLSEPKPAEEILEAVIAPRQDSDNFLYVVQGHAGSGKTTMLRHWAISLANNFETKSANNYPIPIYLSLRFLERQSQQRNVNGEIGVDDLSACFRRTISGLPVDLSKLPFEQLQELWKRKDSRALNRFWAVISKFGEYRLTYRLFQSFRKWIAKSRSKPIRWVFLCDGLDELNREILPAFLHWVKGLPPLTAAVIAMRPDIISQVNVPRTREFAMCIFNNDQIDRFIKQWFPTPSILGNSLIQRVHASQSLQELSGVPLLLTCLCIDVEIRQNSSFPEKMVQSDVLRRIVEILLERWEATKSGRSTDPAMVRFGSSVLAVVAMTTPFGTRVSQTSLANLTKECATRSEAGEEYVMRFLNRITQGSQLLEGSPELGYSFAHKIFFDYFFSLGIVERF